MKTSKRETCLKTEIQFFADCFFTGFDFLLCPSAIRNWVNSEHALHYRTERIHKNRLSYKITIILLPILNASKR